ncbi:MAG: serine O-acetyltransferase [Alphaproteobacteria bacterium]
MMSDTRKRSARGNKAEIGRSEDEIAVVDPVWSRVRREASDLAAAEPALASFLYTTVLHHDRFENAMSYLLAQKLATADLGALLIRQLLDEAYAARPEIGQEMRADIVAIYDRDPASRSYVEPILYFKGFHALQAYRVTHWLWNEGRESMALYLQNTISDRFAVDIHPAARIGRGVLIDHGTGVVIGETAVVEDDVSMLQGVTLGGTGKEVGDRHPKIRRGVLLGAGATVLGNIEVGAYSRVGAGAVVLTPVPEHSTAAGVPARIIGVETGEQPSHAMDHMIRSGDIVDYVI